MSADAVEAFKKAWHEADAEGDVGNRVARGLAAAAPHIAEQALLDAAKEIAAKTPDTRLSQAYCAGMDRAARIVRIRAATFKEK